MQWDAGRIEQLLVNLLENGLRYNQAPGQVRVRLEHAGSKVRVVVDDSSPGVPAGRMVAGWRPRPRRWAACLTLELPQPAGLPRRLPAGRAT